MSGCTSASGGMESADTARPIYEADRVRRTGATSAKEPRTFSPRRTDAAANTSTVARRGEKVRGSVPLRGDGDVDLDAPAGEREGVAVRAEADLVRAPAHVVEEEAVNAVPVDERAVAREVLDLHDVGRQVGDADVAAGDRAVGDARLDPRALAVGDQEARRLLERQLALAAAADDDRLAERDLQALAGDQSGGSGEAQVVAVVVAELVRSDLDHRKSPRGSLGAHARPPLIPQARGLSAATCETSRASPVFPGV